MPAKKAKKRPSGSRPAPARRPSASRPSREEQLKAKIHTLRAERDGLAATVDKLEAKVDKLERRSDTYRDRSHKLTDKLAELAKMGGVGSLGAVTSFQVARSLWQEEEKQRLQEKEGIEAAFRATKGDDAIGAVIDKFEAMGDKVAAGLVRDFKKSHDKLAAEYAQLEASTQRQCELLRSGAEDLIKSMQATTAKAVLAASMAGGDDASVATSVARMKAELDAMTSKFESVVRLVRPATF